MTTEFGLNELYSAKPQVLVWRSFVAQGRARMEVVERTFGDGERYTLKFTKRMLRFTLKEEADGNV